MTNITTQYPFPIIIDCDTGRDDALSLWTALRLDMDLAMVIASYGNTHLHNVVKNSADVLNVLGRNDIPLLAGASAPAVIHRKFEDVVIKRQESTGNGLCNITLPSAPRDIDAILTDANNIEHLAKNIRAVVKTRGQKIDYIILGPATNLAALYQHMGDEIYTIINSVTMMGGKLDYLWDEMPGADFNIACDPLAVQTLLNSALSVNFVTMNFTWPVALSLSDLEELDASSPLAQTAKDLMIAHCKHFAPEPVFRFHDPCVIIAARSPGHFMPCCLSVNCDETSAEFGRLIIHDGPANAQLYSTNMDMGWSFMSQILSGMGLHLPNKAA